MPDRTIEPRPGLEVFVNEGGTISIKQASVLGDDDSIVVVHPDSVDELCAFLQDAKNEAAEISKE